MQKMTDIDLAGLEKYLKDDKNAYTVLISIFKGSNSMEEISSDVCIEDLNKIGKYLKKLVSFGAIDKKLVDSKISYEKQKIPYYQMSDSAAKHQNEIYNMTDF